MRQAASEILVETQGRGLVDVTRQARAFAEGQGMQTGLLTVFCRHTSASVLIQENADPAVRRDLMAWLERIAPEDEALYEHADEGPDDMPAHLRSVLTQTQLTVPLVGGRLALGTWQAIYVAEHRRAPHRRRLVLHILGD